MRLVPRRYWRRWNTIVWRYNLMSRRRLRRIVDKQARELRVEHERRKAVRLENHDLRQRAVQAETMLRRLEPEMEQLQRIAIAESNAAVRRECQKERFHREAEASEWLAKIAENTEQPVDWLEVYPCPVCPRSPLTGSRYLHVRHVDRETKQASLKRRQQAIGEAHRDGRRVEQLIDPEVLARLKAIQ